MDHKTLTYILTAAAAIAYAGLLISIPLRRNKILKAAGQLLFPLENGLTYRVIGIFVIAAGIIALIPLRNFAIYISVILFLCAILATELGVRESVGLGKAGIYKNMIISGTNAIPLNEIYSLPTLAYEDDPETTMLDKRTLEIITNKGTKVILVFSTEDIRQKAVAQILQELPGLKPEK